MPSALYYELEKRVNDEIARTTHEIGSGGCLGGSAEEVYGLYRERYGFVEGMRYALAIAKRIEVGEN